MFKNMLRRSQIALLGKQLMLPIRTYLKIALGTRKIEREVERETLRDPASREIYDRVSVTLPEWPRQGFPAIDLDVIEKEFHRDDAFAAQVAAARQGYSSELRAIREKLHDDRLLLEIFIRTAGHHDNVADFQNVLAALNHVAGLSKPTVPPSPTLMQEAEALAALLRLDQDAC